MSQNAGPTRDRERAVPGRTGQERAALSRELSELLLELSIGVHRYAMYPPGHPSLAPIVENIIGRLGEIFDAEHRSVNIGVARRQLVIEGVATDAGHPVLADLARRLHDHQVSALSFQAGTKAGEIEGLLEALSVDPTRDAEPVGLLPPDEIPTWEHVGLRPIGYDRLGLRDEEGAGGGTDPAQELWLGLARAAMATDGDVDEALANDAGRVAGLIRRHSREEAYDTVIVGYLRQLATELKDRSSGDATKVRERMSSLIRELDEATLQRLVELGGSLEERRAFLLNANQGLAVDAVVKILRSAAAAEGQNISTSLTRMLSKLSAHAGDGEGPLSRQADTALRDNVQRLIDEWELDDPNPDQYTSILDAMAGASPLFDRQEPQGGLAGPERLVKMALEVDAWGMTVKKAVVDLMDLNMSGVLLELVDQADVNSEAAAAIRAYLAEPGPLRRLLSGTDIDEEALNSLVDRMGETAIDPLLEVLAESDSRSVRRKVFDALGRLGPDVAHRAVDRLDDPRWFVLRNMLALLGRMPEIPEGVDLLRFTRHDDPRVRREAFTLVLRQGDLRARTLALALAEPDDRLVRMALLELKEGVPETLVPTVVNRVLKGEHSPDIRALAARTLRGTRSPLVRDSLVELVSGGRSLFGKPRIADPSLEVLTGLEVLSESWARDEEVRPLLEVAAKSKDPRIRKAAGGGS